MYLFRTSGECKNYRQQENKLCDTEHFGLRLKSAAKYFLCAQNVPYSLRKHKAATEVQTERQACQHRAPYTLMMMT